MLIECVEGKGMQEGGGQEYAHTVDHPLHYSILFSLKVYKPCVSSFFHSTIVAVDYKLLCLNSYFNS